MNSRTNNKMADQPTLIVFDFDGTLVDSRKLILEAHRVVFSQFGLRLPSERESLSLIGRSLDLVLLELGGAQAPVDKMVAAYDRVLPSLRVEPAFAEVPFDGAAELLLRLATTSGVRLGIATGHVSRAIIPALAKFGWQNFFCTLQTADKAPSKPHPGMLIQALSDAQTTAGNAIMVGDTAFDMEMAKAAGVRGIGVSWGYHGDRRLRLSGAWDVAENMIQLSDWLFDAIKLKL
jgi:phosphoglycolate phosphatase